MTKLIEIPTLGWVLPSEVRRVQIEVQPHGKTYVLVINGNRWKSSDDLESLEKLEREIVAKINGPDPLRSLLEQAVNDWTEFDTNGNVSGSDLVEWFGGWRDQVKELLNAHN